MMAIKRLGEPADLFTDGSAPVANVKTCRYVRQLDPLWVIPNQWFWIHCEVRPDLPLTVTVASQFNADCRARSL
jgi:hypothetical protein